MLVPAGAATLAVLAHDDADVESVAMRTLDALSTVIAAPHVAIRRRRRAGVI